MFNVFNQTRTYPTFVKIGDILSKCNKYLISYIQQQSLHLIHSICNNNFEVLVESEFWNHIDDDFGDFEVLGDAIYCFLMMISLKLIVL